MQKGTVNNHLASAFRGLKLMLLAIAAMAIFAGCQTPGQVSTATTTSESSDMQPVKDPLPLRVNWGGEQRLPDLKLAARTLREGAIIEIGDGPAPCIEIEPKNPDDPNTYILQAFAPGGKLLAEMIYPDVAGAAIGPFPDYRGPLELRSTAAPAPELVPIIGHDFVYYGDFYANMADLYTQAAALDPNDNSPRALNIRMMAQWASTRFYPDGHPMPTYDMDSGDKDGLENGMGSMTNGGRAIRALFELAELNMGEAARLRPDGCYRMAWIDEIDNSPQFVRSYLPPDYTSEKSWPLVVYQHPYMPMDDSYVNFGYDLMRRYVPWSERHGVIWIESHDRGNGPHPQLAEKSAMDAVAQACETFNVDPDRIYMTGESQGGARTWINGARHPDIFAALTPVFGGWSPAVWNNEESWNAMTERQRWFYETDSAYVSLESLLWTPIYTNHGDADTIAPYQFTEYAVDMLQRWGYPIRFWLHPGMGHSLPGLYDITVPWMKRHRLDRYPHEQRLRAGQLRYAKAGWLQAMRQTDPTKMIEGIATRVSPVELDVRTANTKKIRLSPDASLFSRDELTRVIWNGELAGEFDFSKGPIELTAEGCELEGRVKNPTTPGDVSDFVMTPFAIVAGTTATDSLMKRLCVERAEYFRDQWISTEHVTPRYFLDSEITDEDIAKYSLWLFGGPEENLVTKKLAGGLGVELAPGKIVLPGKTVEIEDAGINVMRPHPLNEDRYVTLVAGNSPQGMYHSIWGVEQVDFWISDWKSMTWGDAPDVTMDQTIVLAGYFGEDWKFNEDFSFWGDPKIRAKAPGRIAPKYGVADVSGNQLILSELYENELSGSFGSAKRDRNNNYGPLRPGWWRTYKRGLGLYIWDSPNMDQFDIGGYGWKRLRGVVGLELIPFWKRTKETNKRTRIVFSVVGDGETLYESPVFTVDKRGSVDLNVDISGVETLEIWIKNEETGETSVKSVDWADLRLEK